MAANHLAVGHGAADMGCGDGLALVPTLGGLPMSVVQAATKTGCGEADLRMVSPEQAGAWMFKASGMPTRRAPPGRIDRALRPDVLEVTSCRERRFSMTCGKLSGDGQV